VRCVDEKTKKRKNEADNEEYVIPR
jgi:hypothetical protein